MASSGTSLPVRGVGRRGADGPAKAPSPVGWRKAFVVIALRERGRNPGGRSSTRYQRRVGTAPAMDGSHRGREAGICRGHRGPDSNFVGTREENAATYEEEKRGIDLLGRAFPL